MSKLIIAEKPSVAKSIASALGASSRADGFYEGSGLLVSWCVGHLVSPMDAGGYDERFKKWRYDDLPILPEPFRYVLASGKEDAFENLRALMNRSDVDTIVNACDAGREGELIFRLVYEMTGCRKPVLRLWISSMEDSAIREGFSDLRPGADYEALYQSALCRQKADWLVGINATRLFSVLYHRTLNVGRVQTPTLAAAAYRSGEKLTNEWDGMTHDYTRKGGVVHTEIMLPPHAPPSFSDRSTLWNSVELYEKAGNAQLAREIDAALPIELSREEQIRLVREYCSSQFVSRGMCVDYAIHDTDSGNPHCHIMVSRS